jgi:ribonuclease HII
MYLSATMQLYYNYPNETQVGVDEAGRGCLLGPVVAAAVVWDSNVSHEGINDSKKLSRKRRAQLREYIETHAIAYGVGMASRQEIDQMNILQATYLAMHRALDQIVVPFDRILVDGDRFPPYRVNVHHCCAGGDALYVPIAAASILAKEHHDEWILKHFPEDQRYDLRNNRGYGTKKHMEGLTAHGLCDEHRRTFCKRFLT